MGGGPGVCAGRIAERVVTYTIVVSSPPPPPSPSLSLHLSLPPSISLSPGVLGVLGGPVGDVSTDRELDFNVIHHRLVYRPLHVCALTHTVRV